jgi:hypothetical protein
MSQQGIRDEAEDLRKEAMFIKKQKPATRKLQPLKSSGANTPKGEASGIAMGSMSGLSNIGAKEEEPKVHRTNMGHELKAGNALKIHNAMKNHGKLVQRELSNDMAALKRDADPSYYLSTNAVMTDINSAFTSAKPPVSGKADAIKKRIGAMRA